MLNKKKYIQIPSQKYEANAPVGTFDKCSGCNKIIYQKSLGKYKICPKCGQLSRLTAFERIKLVCDKDSFVEFNENLNSVNPINFPGYENKIKKAQQQTNLTSAIVTGTCNIHYKKVCIGVMDSHFMMGSLGSVVGEKITRLFEYAIKYKLPVVLFTCSGGARMQETIISLMQMAKVSAVIKRHSDHGLLYISFITDPTTGGVTASFAMQGDIILAEPNALIGFAGRRVIEQTLKENLPDNFQTSEFLLECGFVDKIVPRREIYETLSNILKIHLVGDYNE